MRLDDLLAPENLRRMIGKHPIGDVRPYAGGTETEIESYLDAALGAIAELPGLRLQRQPDHYGQGYASYVECNVWRSDGHGARRSATDGEIDGLALWISRLGPLACLGRIGWSWSEASHGDIRRTYASGVLGPAGLDTVPDDSWEGCVQALRGRLGELGYEIVPRDVANRPLPFDAVIQTNWGQPPYRIFDAVFFWYD